MKKEEMMQVLVVRCGKEPEVQSIRNELDVMQAVVDGFIEPYYFTDEDDVVLICNEEGKFTKSLNRAVYGDDGRMIEVIGGDFFLCRAPKGSENFAGLTEEQTEKYLTMFRYPETFLKYGNDVLVCRAIPSDV